jgi:hypothetical protein
VREALAAAMDPAETLFAKERENISRDEIHQCGLYIHILSLLEFNDENAKLIN